jgi:hypothetical protein
MRMSRNAQRNLKHEELDDEYTSKSTGSNGVYCSNLVLLLVSRLGNPDIMLSNTNMELDFADEHDLRRAVESPTVSDKSAR